MIDAHKLHLAQLTLAQITVLLASSEMHAKLMPLPKSKCTDQPKSIQGNACIYNMINSFGGTSPSPGCVKCWQRNSILKLFQMTVLALTAPKIEPGFIGEQLWMIFNQYTKMYVLFSECVQLTSEQLMTRRLVPLHYS